MQNNSTNIINYDPTPSMKKFMLSKSIKRLLVGPIGSGKTSCSAMEIWHIAKYKVPVCRDGVRRSKFAAIRTTAAELKNTTIQTFRKWFPEGEDITWYAPPNAMVLVRQPGLEIDILFIALDRPEDQKKLLSLDLTGAFINEIREFDKHLIDPIFSRLGRYPSAADRPDNFEGDWGRMLKYLLADTNPPDEDSDWRYIIEDRDPDDRKSFKKMDNGWDVVWQPPAVIKDENNNWEVNLQADNLGNVGVSYYLDMLNEGVSEAFIRVMLANQYGAVNKGGLVHEETFNKDIHVGRVKYNAGCRIVIGMDFGRTPACVFAHISTNGRIEIFDELLGDNIGLTEFINGYLTPRMNEKYPGSEVTIVGDPAGMHKMQGMDLNLFQILHRAGYFAQPAATNDPTVRIGEVDSALSRLIGGKPALVIDYGCQNLIESIGSGYRFSKTRQGEYLKPMKDQYSHVADALQYLVLGAKMNLLSSFRRVSPTDYDVNNGLDFVFRN